MTFSVGIVGCGMIAGGPVRGGKAISGTHAEACRELAIVELTCGADVDAARREGFQKQWGVTRMFASADALLAEAKPDLLIVATTASEHERVCAAAVQHRVRGILCEKPLTGSAASAKRVVDACAAAKIPLVVNFSRRWDPSLRAAREWVAELGPIRSVHGTYSGTLRGNGSHLVDTIRMFAPLAWRVEWAAGAVDAAGDGAISAMLSAPGGARATIDCIDGAEFALFELTFLGTRGRLRLRNSGNDLFIDHAEASADFPGYSMLTRTEKLPGGTLASACKYGLAELADAVGSTRAVDISAHEFVATLSLVDAIASTAQSTGAKTHG
jgi:predicted dehydrogenase